MDYQEYSLKALALARPLDFQGNLIHAALGIISEVGELADQAKKVMIYGRALDRVNLVEEVGDVLWYMNLACHSLQYSFAELPFNVWATDDLVTLAFRSSSIAGHIADNALLVKRGDAVYKFLNDLDRLAECMATILASVDSTPAQAMEANLAKLNKRYESGKFSAEAATNRDTAAERELLEAAVK